MHALRLLLLHLFLFGVIGLAGAQPAKRIVLDHALSTDHGVYSPRTPRFTVAQQETLKILVAMAAFQEDNEPRTTGTGSFDVSNDGLKIIDPPPHDRGYVINHMQFAANYFRKISNGKLIIASTVLDNVYTLPRQMSAYSPPRTSTDNVEIGRLMQDVWHTVDSVTPGIQFENYGAFVVVHAGTGRDVDLASLVGVDPVPFDIPSIYVSLQGLRKMFGSSYEGIPVSNGSFHITNSMILPETETHQVRSPIDNSVVSLPLGLNGLIAASIGSHLGLPDLFDTKTGLTGIGRFGLMDGESIFSWGGVFPPEASAWEKYFLGWISPITIPPGEAAYTLPAVSLNSEPDSVYLVPISAREYFLVENRNRDANGDGVTFTIERSGAIIQKTFVHDDQHFNAFNQDSIYGNVIDVDEFDWSMPGGTNTETGEFFDGGILIWHVDETVIDANYTSDAVNANIDRRGVNLEEGDGAQDIGRPTNSIINTGVGSGTPLDFWYKGNSAIGRRRYNEFTPTSNPSSMSNDFANSHIYVRNFSPRGPRMTATIQLGDDELKLLPTFPKNIGRIVRKNSAKIADLPGYGPALFVTTTGGVPPRLSPQTGLEYSFTDRSLLYAWKVDGTAPAGFFSSGLIAQTPESPPADEFIGTPVAADLNEDLVLDIVQPRVVGHVPNIGVLTLRDLNADSLADEVFSANSFQQITTSPVAGDSMTAIGTRLSGIIFIPNNTTPPVHVGVATFLPNDTSAIVGLSLWRDRSTFVAISEGGTVGLVTSAGVVRKQLFSRVMSSPAISGTMDAGTGPRIIFASRDGFVYLVDSTLAVTPGFPFSTGTEILNSPALGDVDADGRKDIIVFSGNRIYAINAAGSLLDNFPLSVSTEKPLLTSPIVADVDGDGAPDIVAVTQEGLVVAYNRWGKMVRGFPILAGSNSGSTPAAFEFPLNPHAAAGIGLAVASDDGHMYAWQTGTLGPLPADGMPPWNAPWPQYLHDARNTGLDASVTTPVPCSTCNGFFPASRTYNWPNPVGAADNYKTHIRYYVASDADVVVKIFDMAGDLVATLDGKGVGGLDNELEWNVSDIQSGVYYAHIDAQGTNGNGSAVIKIAVVK